MTWKLIRVSICQSICFWQLWDNSKNENIILGGGLVDEGEVIEVVELSIPEAREYAEAVDNISPAGFSFGLVWFFMKKAPTLLWNEKAELYFKNVCNLLELGLKSILF